MIASSGGDTTITVVTFVSILLGFMNLIQWIVALATGTSLRAQAQSQYNDWYRVAQIADEISKSPDRAPVLVGRINGMADAKRNEIKSYSREKLGFVPWYDPAYESGPNPTTGAVPPKRKWVTFKAAIKAAFVPK
jgi:hypothetical protein